MTLAAPDREPLRLTIPAGRLGGAAAGYVCVEVLAGTPDPLFDGFFTANTWAFVEQGKTSATAALPSPNGFTLPAACAFVAAPVVTPDQTDWAITCGSAKDRDIRGTLAPSLTQQGWTSCASGLASAQWRKGSVMLGVSESSLAPGDHPRLTQFARLMPPC